MQPELFGLGVGDGVIEAVQTAVVMREMLAHQRLHSARGFVSGEAQGDRAVQSAWQRLAVVRIEIPYTALRCTIRIQQKARLATHLAIEELHAQLSLATGPTGEPGPRAEEDRKSTRLNSSN